MTAPKFLIDENLSVILPAVAHARGYHAAHVARRGLHRWKDWDLMELIGSEDWVLVTNNAIEFRGRYRRASVHPGVIFIVPSVGRASQRELFGAALTEVDRNADLVNAAIDVLYDGDEIVVRRYPLP